MTSTQMPPAPIGSGRVCVMAAFYQSRMAKSIRWQHRPEHPATWGWRPHKLPREMGFHPEPKMDLYLAPRPIPVLIRPAQARGRGRVSATS
jgi:hypothetical protein